MELSSIHPSWQNLLAPEFDKPYFKSIIQQINHDEQLGKIIYPPKNLIFRSLNTPFHEVKVVIIGQDPYHGTGEANGHCFSVNKGIKTPPSLKNIYKELKNNFPNFVIPNHGNLDSRAKQGVLLLNTSLTVVKDMANSHSKIGWTTFTNKIIKSLSTERENVVFILWGKNAIDKAEWINPNKHLVLKSVHPSPLSASRGFFGNHHFSKTNEYLIAHQKGEINWQITDSI